MTEKVTAIIQARMGSTRLPGKSLRPLAGVPLLEHVIKRTQAVAGVDGVIVALPDSPREAPLAELARRLGAKVCHGPEEDVLARFIIAGEAARARHIMRICADNPLLDIPLMQELTGQHLARQADYTFTPDVVPLGTGSEVVFFPALQKIAGLTAENRYREHVTTYFHDHPGEFNVCRAAAPPHLRGRNLRLTVDTEADWRLQELIYKQFYSPANPLPSLPQVLAWLEANPQITALNAGIEQKNWRLER